MQVSFPILPLSKSLPFLLSVKRNLEGCGVPELDTSAWLESLGMKAFNGFVGIEGWLWAMVYATTASVHHRICQNTRMNGICYVKHIMEPIAIRLVTVVRKGVSNV